MATETLRPNAAGDKAECIRYGDCAAGQNWECVDEAVSDGDTTRVGNNYTTLKILTDLHNIPNTSIPDGATINSIRVYCMVRNIMANYGKLATKIKTGGVEHKGAIWSWGTSYTLISTLYALNPNTGLAWTIAEINALQIGVHIETESSPYGYTVGYCTQVYVIIDFTLEAPPPSKAGLHLTKILPIILDD